MIRLTGLLVVALSFSACSGDSGVSPSRTEPDPLPNFGGNWQGSYVVTSCTQGGLIALVNICGRFPTNTILPFRYSINQSGRTVTGVLLLGSVSFPVNADVATDNSLTVNSSTTSESLVITLRSTIRKSGNTISGTITQTWEALGLSGQAIINSNLGPASSIAVTAPTTTVVPRSIEEALGAIQR